MIIRQQDENGIRIITLEGRIDVDGAIELEQVLQDALQSGRTRIILDMGLVDYLNTSGLHTLAEVHTHSRRNGGELRFAKLSPIVQRVFEMVGFRKFFRNYSSIEAAKFGF